MDLAKKDQDQDEDLDEIDPADVGSAERDERGHQEEVQRRVVERAHHAPILVVRDQLRVHAELGQRRGKVERGVRVMTREELLRGDVRNRDRVDVVALAEEERHRGEHECGEREAGGESVARRWPEPSDAQDWKHADDDERHHVVGCDEKGLHNEVPLDDRRHGRDREEAQTDAAKPLVRIGGGSVEERRHEVDQRENGCERQKRWECTGQGLGAEEADRRRPQREGGNGQGTERRRRREVAEKGGQEVEPGREHVPAERGDGDEIRDRRQQKSKGYRPARRMAGRGDEDEREIEGVPDGEGEIGSASLLRVANAGGGDDPRRRERECGAEKRAGGHATTQGSGVTCQRGVSATFV